MLSPRLGAHQRDQNRHWQDGERGLPFDDLDFRRLIMRSRLVLLAVAIMVAPLAVQAADLVVWWEEGYNPDEDSAVREIVAAFERGSDKQVELVFHPQQELPGKIMAALKSNRPPGFVFGTWIGENIGQWAFDDRLVDLSDIVGHFSDLFDPDALDSEMLLNAKTGQEALYALPLARSSNHVHVWKSLLQQAGLSLADVPREWEAFWAFWCARVQPAVRRATGGGDIWGVALPMSAGAGDTYIELNLFVAAYGADYVTPAGQR
jgi:multiple sugar transport system substrate-binding protein